MADYTGGFDTTGDILLNFDITRTAKFVESFVVPPTRKYRLKYVPKDHSLSSLGFTVVNSTDPQVNYIGIDYAPDNEYQAASGIVWFNVGDVGRLVQVQYIPIGSRIDANDLNPALQWVHAYRNAVPTKVELATPGKARVSWGNIVDAPGAATPDSTGFMSLTDKRALDATDPTKKPVGGFRIGSANLNPTVWGGNIELGTEGNVWPEFLGSKIIFRLDPATKGLVDDKTLAALAGTKGVPSASNKFVTEEDDRIKNPGIPNHTHPVTDVVSLQTKLNSKSMVGHGHTTADISGLNAALSGVASATHKHTIADVTGLQPALDDKAALVHTHNDLKQAIQAKAPVGHGHDCSEVSGLENMIAGMIAGQPDDPNNIDVRGLSGKLANLEYIVKDGLLTGFQTQVASTDPTKINIAAGDGYVGGMRVNYLGGQVNCLAVGDPVKTVGAAGPLGPKVLGEYPLNTPVTYTLEILTANRNPGMLLDMSFKLTSSDGAKNETQVYQAFDYPTIEDTAVVIENGFAVGFTMTSTGVYAVGDKWTITVPTSGNTHIYIDGVSNEIIKRATPAGTTTPPAVNGAKVLATVAVASGSATGVTDRRGAISPVVSLQELNAITQPQGDSSKRIATTEFVTQAITATSTAVISHTSQVLRGTTLAAPPGTSLANATNVSLRVIADGIVYWGFSYIDYFKDVSGERINASYAFACDHATNKVVCRAVEGFTINEVKIYVTGGK